MFALYCMHAIKLTFYKCWLYFIYFLTHIFVVKKTRKTHGNQQMDLKSDKCIKNSSSKKTYDSEGKGH